MGEHSISSIKKAAKRILGSYFFRCILASFITGTGILLIFNYILDGSIQVSNAFDTEAFYQSLMSASSVDELYSTIYNRISSLVQSVGYDTYSIMLRRFAIASIVSYLIRLMYNFLVVYPFEVGNCSFYMEGHYKEPKFRTLITAFEKNYLNTVLIQFLRHLKIFLWSLLFIIPGVIKSYETFMVPYLLAENPDIDRREIFVLSRRMMDGNKMNLFILNLSFIGWMFLSMLTSGLAYIFFVGPYYDASLANMAMRIKAQYNNLTEDTAF